MWGANMDEGTCAFPLHGIEGVWPDSFLISGDRLRLPLPAPARNDPIWIVTKLQQLEQFDQPSLICPCLHTIGLKDLIVPPRGIGELVGRLEISTCVCQRPSHWGMRRPPFIEVKPCHSTKKNFSKNRSKNAASLRGKQRTRRTEHFGGKLLGVGRNMLRQAQEAERRRRQLSQRVLRADA
jgi:hypothetical protein